ncbi:purine-nucleoside phosphorylase [Kyrpidia sp.]|uniref:purine-nucleoside phosphorylase n=1 Tax=Kyrpidia sp. TaxID=2073077 RepID=UPI00258816AD|nr:purine-nucleoside phosphorylase [Kyrpidia sp.]MCL6575745.1 purine-nucleoside phosphorylase [Kyrpidia sp.]
MKTQWVREVAERLEQGLAEKPRVAVILGSGLGGVADRLEAKRVVPYEEIPEFPVSTVVGHAGRLVFGRLGGVPTAVMQGRFHLYEGYTPEQVAFPVRVLRTLGAEILIVTNASGGVNIGFRPGDLMLIRDHLNLTGKNPLVGPNDDELGPRFPDMSAAYDRELLGLARQVGREFNLPLQEGVYAGLLGPTFETPAEIRMLRVLGADAVGMSTVTEVIAARHVGMRVLGISCITNMAAGILDQPLSHEEVLETGRRIGAQFSGLITEIVSRL